nr:hypothetical protein [Tanacetum cinerariifolium]
MPINLDMDMLFKDDHFDEDDQPPEIIIAKPSKGFVDDLLAKCLFVYYPVGVTINQGGTKGQESLIYSDRSDECEAGRKETTDQKFKNPPSLFGSLFLKKNEDV